MNTNPKCSSCRRYFEPKLKTDGLFYKTCEICQHRDKDKKKCEHNRRKTICKECKGGRICEHSRIKSDCKQCGNVINIVIKTFITSSKISDKKYNRLDIVNFIDKDFCKLLIEESDNKCCYCQCSLEFVTYGPNLISIERVDNSIGHIKSNVKISCLSCNVKNIGRN